MKYANKIFNIAVLISLIHTAYEMYNGYQYSDLFLILTGMAISFMIAELIFYVRDKIDEKIDGEDL